MANIRLSRITLIDNWPGVPEDAYGIPADGWDNTVDNFKTTSAADQPSYPVGTKISAYTDNTNCPGRYTMMYLMYHCWSSTAACVSADFSDGKFFCSHVGYGSACTAQFADTHKAPYFVVGNCYTSAAGEFTNGSPIAIPCCSMSSDGTTAATNGYGDFYGWFWVGGVCPCKDVTILDDSGFLTGVDITTEATMRAGPIVACYTSSTLIPASDDTIFGDQTECAGKAFLPFGWACCSAA